MAEIAVQVGSSLDELTREFNIITHNLANVSTTGYKRRYNTFSKSLIDQGIDSSAETGGEVESSVTFDFSQGRFVETGRPLDLALGGKGFFVVETTDGPLYTRNGMFYQDQNGQIVDSEGRIISGEGGPISIPPNVSISQVAVSADGSISAGGTTIGKFKLVDFKDKENELVAVGLHCFWVSEDVTAEPAENLVVKQGFQESSNVQLVEELVEMMMVSKLYEANMKFVAAAKETSQSLIGVAMA